MLLGMSADEVAPLKEAPDPKPYEGLLERVAWSEWLLRVQSRTQCAPLLAARLLRPAPTLKGFSKRNGEPQQRLVITASL